MSHFKNKPFNKNTQAGSPSVRFGEDTPYHHVPLLKDSKDKGQISTPKVKSIDSAHHNYSHESFSGSLQCSLTCLTDCLFGNYQDELKKFPELLKSLESDFSDPVNSNKKVVVPNFFAGSSGNVAMINGSTIAGMLRNNIASLVSAPMQRVTEKTLSYRPNMAVDRKSNPTYESFVGLIERPQSGEKRVNLYRVEYDFRNPSIQFGFKNNFSSEETYDYLGGTDIEGQLASAFKRSARVHKSAGFDASTCFVGSLPLTDELIKQFELTTVHLTDEEYGHISSNHPLSDQLNKEHLKKGIKKNRDVCGWFDGKGRALLIYVEAELNQQGKPARVVSFGNHYRYRWRYKDSVRYLKSGVSDGELRPELTLSEDEAFYFWNAQQEQLPRHDLPNKLNIARSLFGDVYQQDELLPKFTPKSSGTFDRFAGKVSINHALEWSEDEKSSVFSKSICYAVPRPGSPKPNAEHNLKQNSKSFEIASWGWLADDKGSELAGRKFYRHQRTPKTFEKGSDAFEKNLQEEHAPLLHYVSPKETQYRTTIRFKNLSKIELGMLALSLQPDLILNDSIIDEMPPLLKKYLTKVKQYKQNNKINDKAIFGHKLGYGRSIGMGSVALNIDHADLFKNDQNGVEKGSQCIGFNQLAQVKNAGNELDQAVLAALHLLLEHSSFLNKKGETSYVWINVFLPWLILKNYQNAEESITYPERQPRVGKNKPPKEATTVEYHSSLRNIQIKQRRYSDESKGSMLENGKHGLLKPHVQLKEYKVPEK